jgi:N-acetyl-anhydromuramyl-L-alanine amidase AmpD
MVLARVNTYMTNENKKLLINLLDQFFTEYDINERNMLTHNDVAKLLKKRLLEKSRWKNLSRGKAIVGEDHKENLNKANKSECPF